MNNVAPLRHRLWRLVPAIVASAVLSMLGSAPLALAAGMSASAQALAKVDDEWSAAAVAHNIDLTASYYAEDAIAYPPNEPAAMGKAAAKKIWASYLSDPTLSIAWKTVHAEVSKSGELGFTSGTYTMSFKGPDGKMVNDTGKYVCVWHKQKDGSWKAIHDMWNSDLK